MVEGAAKDGGFIDAQENLGYYGGQADGFANEEWFAIVAVDRRVRQSYLNFQSDFATVVPPADLDRDGLPECWSRLIDMNGVDAFRQLTRSRMMILTTIIPATTTSSLPTPIRPRRLPGCV